MLLILVYDLKLFDFGLKNGSMNGMKSMNGVNGVVKEARYTQCFRTKLYDNYKFIKKFHSEFLLKIVLSPKTFLILRGFGAVFVFKLWSFVTRYEVSPEKKYNPSKESRYCSLFLKPMSGTSFYP